MFGLLWLRPARLSSDVTLGVLNLLDERELAGFPEQAQFAHGELLQASE